MDKIVFWGKAVLIVFVVLFFSQSIFVYSANRKMFASEIKITQEWKGHYSGYNQQEMFVITTKEEWSAVWKKVHSLQLSIPVLPEIDFDKEMVIAVFMGEKSSGGYIIEVTKIIKTDKEVVVEIMEKTPAPGTMKTMALTQPYHLVVIEKSNLPVVFQQT
ncbi:MAG: protease complex subunit PrcB family protein [Candidatus Omnitrophota bacterium]